MKLNCFTIVLDGMPYITRHHKILCDSGLDWSWCVVEGVARPTKDTSWVKGIPPRLSNDGTTEYLRSIKDKRVRVVQKPRWENKTSMCNEAVSMFSDGVLLQMDSDEIWGPQKLATLVEFFYKSPHIDFAKFYCNYYLGPDILATSKDGYGNRASEWLRAWRFRRGNRFLKHEPPVLSGVREVGVDRSQTARLGLVFDHYAYALEHQVAFKEEYYGYGGAVEGWMKLQNNDKWPVTDLREFLPWVGPNATADKIKR